MLKRIVLILLLLIQPMFAWAESDIDNNNDVIIENKNLNDNTSELIMSPINAVKMAGRLIDMGDYEHAAQILTKMPDTTNLDVEIERWYLIAQIAQRNGDYDTAIQIYKQLLDEKPDLVKVRYELALCYMAKKQWYRADYHLRLAMAGNDIPDFIKKQMIYYRYIARKNKRWNVWFNFGAAPDSNINQVSGGNECVLFWGICILSRIRKAPKCGWI